MIIETNGDFSYDDLQRRRDAEVRGAWEALPLPERARIEAGLEGAVEYPVSLRKDAAGRGVHESSHEPCALNAREVVGDAEDVATSCDVDTEMASEPVFCEERISDFLEESFGLSARQACEVSDWYLRAVNGAAMQETAGMLAQVIGMFLLPGNLQMKAHALAHAAHMAEGNGLPSMRASAEVCGVSPEGMRRAVMKWQELLGLPEVKGKKSKEACEAYRAAALGNHWRHRKVTAGG